SKLSSFTILKEALEAGLIKINYLVKSQANKQYETIIHPENITLLKDSLEQTRPQATRQRQILSFFIERNEPIKQAILYNELGITRAHLNPLIEKQLIRISQHEIYRDPYAHEIKQTEKLSLMREQE